MEGKDAAGVDGSVRRRGRRVLKSGTGGGRSQLSRSLRDGGEDLDEGKEGLLDRRRSSADVELVSERTEKGMLPVVSGVRIPSVFLRRDAPTRSRLSQFGACYLMRSKA